MFSDIKLIPVKHLYFSLKGLVFRRISYYATISQVSFPLRLSTQKHACCIVKACCVYNSTKEFDYRYSFVFTRCEKETEEDQKTLERTPYTSLERSTGRIYQSHRGIATGWRVIQTILSIHQEQFTQLLFYVERDITVTHHSKDTVDARHRLALTLRWVV